MRFLEAVKKVLGEAIEIGLLLIAVGIVIQILFGGTGGIPFFQGIMANVMGLIGGAGQEGLVGLLGLGFIVWLFYRRKTAA